MTEPSDHIPKFRQVEKLLRRLISASPVGTKLPAERELAANFDCNFLTIRRAMSALVDDGTVIRKIGSGTFVQRHDLPDPASPVAQTKVGILVHRLGHAYAYNVLRAAAQSAANHSIDVRSAWVKAFDEQALQQAHLLADKGCRSIILPWFPHEHAEEVRRFVEASPLPISVPLLIPGLEDNCFESRSAFGMHAIAGIESICAYYQAIGYNRIAFLGPDTPDDPILQKKLSAYACHTSRCNLLNICGLAGAQSRSMDQLAKRWIEAHNSFAVISYDDEHALRFMTAMHKRGRSAPEDYQIIGFNDIEASRYSDPPLSTVIQDFEYIGEGLLKNALALAEGKVSQSGRTPRTRLLVRSTCGGAERIDHAMREQLPGLEMILSDSSSFTPSFRPNAPTSSIASNAAP